ncbi:MAG: ABC transporter ATP-binding protein [Flavobacteriaceae bacterium]|jgi:ABC-type Fe3+/spermidine/putrescine transport system ATPase subunit|nr:ABC transporter ATP-binding protein [Flavobacteriaceae bacterium]
MLTVQNISFSYIDQPIIKDVSFAVEKGKNIAVMGESGCGKSTLLKLIYGLYDLDNGNIFWNNTEVLGPKYHLVPGMEFMKYLAQDFDLMPYISVAENVGKFLSNFYPEQKKTRIAELLETVEMTAFTDVKAKFLSGGQMQRVALARVLAHEPELILLDEPFSHIDSFRKNSLRRKLFAYLKEKEITCITATHDNMDVLPFSDSILVMQNGKIVETGTPHELYKNPKNKYTASLFGDVNEIPSRFLGVEDSEEIKMVYPDKLKIVERSPLKVIVQKSYFQGRFFLIEATHEQNTIYFQHETSLNPGSEVYLKNYI